VKLFLFNLKVDDDDVNQQDLQFSNKQKQQTTAITRSATAPIPWRQQDPFVGIKCVSSLFLAPFGVGIFHSWMAQM
jgi:hypothetical protein